MYETISHVNTEEHAVTPAPVPCLYTSATPVVLAKVVAHWFIRVVPVWISAIPIRARVLQLDLNVAQKYACRAVSVVNS